MFQRTVLICFIGLLIFPGHLEARQESTPIPDAEATESSSGQWSLETSLSFPMARIYMLKASYKYSEKVELGIGPAFQKWENLSHSPLGQTNAYTLLMSYRYFFLGNFHAEVELWPAWNKFESFYDGNTYRGLELWAEYKLGYRLNLSPRFYLNLQPGIGHAIWMQKKWPDIEYNSYREFLTGSVIFVPQVMAGIRF